MCREFIDSIRHRQKELRVSFFGFLPLVALCLTAGSPFPVYADENDPFSKAAYSFRVFRDSDGLPQNTVHAITRDLQGFLWVGTQDGAAYFDGRKWTVVDMPSRLRSNFVRSILSASDGSLWFGTQAGGLFRLHEGRWTAAEELCRLTACGRVNTLVETTTPTGEPVIWAGTYGEGVGRFADGHWTLFSTAEGLPSNRVWTLAAETKDGETTLWAGTEKGLAVLRPGLERWTTEDGFPPYSTNSLALSHDPVRGRVLWAGTYGRGLFTYEKGRWSQLTTVDGLPSDFLTSLVTVTPKDGSTTAWAGTDGGGVVRIEGGALETISTSTGLPSDAVYSLLETRETDQRGMLWVGTRNGGLAQLVDGKWRKLSPDPWPLPDPVNAILETTAEIGSSPQIWLGTDGRGLWRLNRGSWSQISGGPPSDTVQCLAPGKEPGAIWVGTRNGGLGHFAKGKWQVFTEASGALPSDLVQVVHSTRDDEGSPLVWVGTRSGLAQFSAGKWRHFRSEDGLPHNSILTLLETGDSKSGTRLWAGTFNGLAVDDGTGWRKVEISPELANSSIQCLHEHRAADGRRTMWVGTDGGGITVFDPTDGATVLFTLTDRSIPALPNNVVSKIVEDRFGRIYALTNGGVARIETFDQSSIRPTDYEIQTYTMVDGLPLNEGNRGAAVVDRTGRVWVGTVGGAAVIDPKIEQPDRTSDPLILKASRGPESSAPLASGLTLGFRERRIVFSYALLSYFHEDRTRYRTQLVGLDEEPSPWTPDSDASYQALADGDYIFKVWGRDAAGNVSGPQEFSFSVSPAPWESWWAYVLMAALLALAVVVGHRVRTRAIRDRETRLAALVDARTRRLSEANQLLVELSYADPLTGVGNRRRFDELYAAEWRRATRTGKPVSLIIFDLDLLKVYNDNFGHAKGDECLKAVAAAVADALPRAGDSISRFGGDEFAVILPATDSEGAITVAENLRRAVGQIKLERSNQSIGPFVTITCGVGTHIPAEDDDPEKLIEFTDKALYFAKKAGRNRVGTAFGEASEI